MIRPLLAFGFALTLLSCASTSARPLRVVDCTHTAYCTAFDEGTEAAWSAKHEALYWQGVQSILHEMNCRKVPSGRRLAYVAAKNLSIPCASGPAQLHHVKDRDQGNRLLAARHVDYIVEFERANASLIRRGIAVPFSAAFYGPTKKKSADSRLEGMDNYLIVQTEAMTEVRLLSRAAHE